MEKDIISITFFEFWAQRTFETCLGVLFYYQPMFAFYIKTIYKFFSSM